MKSGNTIILIIAIVFTCIFFQGCSEYNLDERPKWAYISDQGANLREMKYPAGFYMTFLGEGRSYTQQDARKKAERDALRQLSETIQSRISSEMSIETSMIKKAGIYRQEVHLNEVIQVKSNSEIPNFSITDIWDIGIDREGRKVSYVLGVFDIIKATETVSQKCKNILSNVKNYWRKIQDFYEKQTPAKLPLLLSEMVLNFENAKNNFPVFYYLAGKLAYNDVKEISQIKLEFDALISESISRLTYTALNELSFVRGYDNSRLNLKISVPYKNLKLSMRSTKFKVETNSYSKVITTNDDGTLDIQIPTENNLRSGRKTLTVVLWLQEENTKNSEISNLENKCKFTVSYSLKPDFEKARKHIDAAENLIQQKNWEKAITEYEESKIYIWDIPSWLAMPNKKIALCRFNINWLKAVKSIDLREFESAITYYEICKKEAKKGDFSDEFESADASWRDAVYQNAKEQIKTGNKQSREFALDRLQLIPGSFRRDEIPYLILEIKRKLPCPVCGFTGKCTQCEGAGKILSTCRTCAGKGIVKEKCRICGGSGYEKCPVCNGIGFSWERCDNCMGTGKIKCPKCSGKGEFQVKCTKCDGKGTIAVNNELDKSIRTKCPDCDGKGFKIIRCTNCNGNGLISCPICTRGHGSKSGYVKQDCSNCIDGRISCRNRNCRNGWLSEICPECAGRKQIYYPCRKCNGTGICPYCHGIGHRP